MWGSLATFFASSPGLLALGIVVVPATVYAIVIYVLRGTDPKERAEIIRAWRGQ